MDIVNLWFFFSVGISENIGYTEKRTSTSIKVLHAEAFIWICGMDPSQSTVKMAILNVENIQLFVFHKRARLPSRIIFINYGVEWTLIVDSLP